MSFTAREVIMTFRGQNYLSSALRRVGNDVGALSRTQTLTAQRARLEQNRRTIQNELAGNITAQKSLQAGGARYLAMQKLHASALARQEVLTTQVSRREQDLAKAGETRAKNANKIKNIENQIASSSGILTSQQAAVKSKIAQYETGQKALAVEKSMIIAEQSESRQLERNDALQKSIKINKEQQLRVQAQIQKLSLIPMSSKKYVGVPEQLSALQSQKQRLPIELEQLYQKQVRMPIEFAARQSAELERIAQLEKDNEAQVASLTAEYERLGGTSAANLAKLRENLNFATRDTERFVKAEQLARDAVQQANLALEQQGLTLDQIAARETELMARETQLTAIISARKRALELNTQELRRNAIAQNSLKWENWERGAQSIQHVSRVMAMFGLVSTAAIGYAAEAAAKFKTQFTLAATQARPPGAPASVTTQIASSIQSRVMGMMQKFPATAQEMAQSFYEIFSGTNIQNVNKAADAVRTFNMMAVAGGTDLKTMTDAGISMYNNFGGLHGEFKNMTDAANAFFATVRYGRMNAIQWAQAMPAVLSIAKSAGLTYKDVSETMAAATRQTGARYTSRDAQGLARLIQLFARTDVTKGLEQKGIQVFDHGKMVAPLKIIEQIHDKLHLTNQEALTFFKTISASGSGKGGTQGTIQAIRLFSFLNESIHSAVQLGKTVRQDQNEMVKSFQAMNKSPGIQWQVFINQLKVLIYEIGTGAIPAFIELSKPLVGLVHWFSSLSSSTKDSIGYFIAIGSAVALVTGSVVGFVAMLATMILRLRLVIGFAREGAGLFGMLGFGAKGAAADAGKLGLALKGVEETGSVMAKVSIGLGLVAAIALAIRYHKELEAALKPMMRITSEAMKLAQIKPAEGSILAILGLLFLAGRGGRLNAAIRDIGGGAEGGASLATRIGEYGFGAGAAAAAPGAKGVGLLGRLGILGRAVFKGGLFGASPDTFASQKHSASSVSFLLSGIKNAEEFKAIAKANNISTSDLSRAGFTAARLATIGYKVVGDQLVRISTLQDKIAAKDKREQAAKVRAFGRQMGDPFQGTRTIFKPTVDDRSLRQKLNDAVSAVRNARIHMRNALQIQQDHPSLQNLTIFKKAVDKVTAALKNLAQIKAALAVGPQFNPQTGQVITHKQGRTVQQWIAAVENAKKITIAHPHDLQAALAFEKISAKLNEQFKNQPDLLAAINDVLGSYDSGLKKAATDQKKLADSSVVNFGQVLQGVQQMYNQFLQQEQTTFGQLFQGPFLTSPAMQNFQQYGGIFKGDQLTKDLQSQISQFTRFHRLLNDLQKRGAPKALIDELTALGPAAIDQIRALTRMSGPELQKYFALYRSAQQLIHKQTMSDLRNQLKAYRQYGRNMAMQIVAGLKDENTSLTKALTNMIRQIFGGKIPTTGGIHHHHHIHHHVPRVHHQREHHIRHRRTHNERVTQGVEEHTHYHITAPVSETASIKAQLRHAHFVTQQKHRVPR